MPSHIELIVVPKLNKILKERKMTQSQLAELTGITQASISRFDRNKQHLDVHLFSISKTLGISVEDLFDIKIVEKGTADAMSELTEQNVTDYKYVELPLDKIASNYVTIEKQPHENTDEKHNPSNSSEPPNGVELVQAYLDRLSQYDKK